MILLILSGRGVLRNFTGSFLSLLSVFTASIALFFTASLLEGMDKSIIENYLKTSVAPVSIVSRYNLNENNMGLIENSSEVVESITNKIPSLPYTKRLIVKGGVLYRATEIVATIYGLNIETDGNVFSLLKEESKERLSKNEGFCILGSSLYESLDASEGAVCIVRVKTVYGGVREEPLVIAGKIKTDDPLLNESAIITSIQTAARMFDAGDSVSEICVKTKSRDKKALVPLISSLENILPLRVKVILWHERLSDVLSFFEARRNLMGFILILLMLVSVTGITNTIFCAVARRTHEIATLGAMGMGKIKISLLFIFEALIIVCLGYILALLVSAIPLYLFSVKGINLPEASLLSNMPITRLYGSLNPIIILAGAIVFIISATLASAYPAYRAATMNISSFLREDT